MASKRKHEQDRNSRRRSERLMIRETLRGKSGSNKCSFLSNALTTSLYGRGYLVMKRFFDMSSTSGKEMFNEVLRQVDNDRSFSNIFNTGKQGKRSKRSQKVLEKNDITRTWVTRLSEFVHEHINPCLIAEEWVVLLSSEGCERQLAHTDYDYNELKPLLNTEPCHMPLSVIVAVMPGTSVHVWERSHEVLAGNWNSKRTIRPKKLKLNPGDVFLFRPDLVHSGSEYERRNVRLHCYIDSPLMKRRPDNTWIVRSKGNENVMNIIRED